MRNRNTNSLKVFFIVNALLLLFSLNTSDTFAEFYVIAGSRGVGTEIKSLPYTISSPGFYYITKDLSCSGSHGITIDANNVTLDLMGFSLIGGGTGDYNGIYICNTTNIEIRNGTVRNFPMRGIYEFSSAGKGHRIINIRAMDNEGAGIFLQSKNNLVEGCTAGQNGFDKGGWGIIAKEGSTITGNTCYGNKSDGIVGGFGSTITGNTCYSNVDNGIYANSGSTVIGNTCYSNTASGIYAAEGSTVIGNTCRSNTGYGIYLILNNLVDQNTATGNGIHRDMSYCSSCTFGNNHAPDPEIAP